MVLTQTQVAKIVTQVLSKQLQSLIVSKGSRALSSAFRKKRKKGRKSRRRSEFRNSSNVLRLGSARNKAFIPSTALISHNWSGAVSIDGSDMDGTKVTVRLNDIHDPLPGYPSTPQPFGSDQMHTLYKKYTVVGVTWKVYFHSSPANGAQGANASTVNAKAFALVGRTDAHGDQETLPTTADEYYMEGWNKGGGYIRHVYGGKGPTVISGKWSAKKQFKEYVDDDKLIRDTNIGAAVGASPTTKANLIIGTFNDDNSNPLKTMYRIVMTYHVLWHDPKELGLS